jgi:hypothetical protein
MAKAKKTESRIVENSNTFEIIRPAPAIDYKKMVHLIYTGNTQLSGDPRKRTIPSFIEAMHRKLPHAERGKEFYAALLHAMAGEIIRTGETFTPIRPPYFNDPIFKETYNYILEKTKRIWTMDQVCGILIYSNIKIENSADAKKYAEQYDFTKPTSGRKLKELYNKYIVTEYRVKHMDKLMGIERELKKNHRGRYYKDIKSFEVFHPKQV